ncbi:MAG: DUF2513 domain-containing protein [Rhodospirillaceae bacterium]|nr:DUF2513 domain-containing protein [Rhodospirillaceae bacterium]
MKRNMDLAREILLRIEATEPRDAPKLDIPGFEEEEIGLHVELVIEHGFVKGITIPRGDGRAHTIAAYRIEGLTWEGHDFLDAARKETIWKKAKEKCLEATGGLAFDALKACLVELGKEAISRS